MGHYMAGCKRRIGIIAILTLLLAGCGQEDEVQERIYIDMVKINKKWVSPLQVRGIGGTQKHKELNEND